MLELKNKYILIGIGLIGILIIAYLILSRNKQSFITVIKTITKGTQIILNMEEKERESDEKNFWLYGSAVGPSGNGKIPIQRVYIEIRNINDPAMNLISFAAQDQSFVKGVTYDGNGMIVYAFNYTGSINDFGKSSQPNITTYTDLSNLGYKIFSRGWEEVSSEDFSESQNNMVKAVKKMLESLIPPAPVQQSSISGKMFRFVRISKDLYSNIDFETMDNKLELSRIALINKNNTRYNHPNMKFVLNSSPEYGTVNSINIRDDQKSDGKFFSSERGFVVLDFGQELNSNDFSRLEVTAGNLQDNNTKGRINGTTVTLLTNDGNPLNFGVPLIYNRKTNNGTVSLSMYQNAAQFYAVESACNPSKGSNCILQISGLKVMNTSSPSINLALDKPHLMTTAFEKHSGFYTSDKAVDDKNKNMAITQENGGMFLVDLGPDVNLAQIDRVEFYNRFASSDADVMRQEGVKVSFVNLVSGSNVDRTYQIIPAADLTFLFYQTKPAIKEIVVSAKPGAEAFHLSELAIYTDNNDRLIPDGTKKVTYENPGGIWDGNYVLANAYDGKITTTYHTAAGNTNRNIKITFDSPRQDIKRVVFDNRSDERWNNRFFGTIDTQGGTIAFNGPTGKNLIYEFGRTETNPVKDRFTYSVDFLDGRDIRIADLPVNKQKFLVKDPHKNKCVDDRGATDADRGKQLYTYECKTTNNNQQWTYDYSTGLIKNANKNLCWDDGGWTSANRNTGGPKMTTQPCDANNTNQQWMYNTRTRQFYNPNKTNQCVDDGDGNSMYLWDCTLNNGNQRFDIQKI
jgi:hypothetical protein